jgi:hypothetical protein
MKLRCVNPGTPALTPGIEYEVTRCFLPGYYLIGDPPHGIHRAINDFETPLFKFTRLMAATQKVVIPNFDRYFRFYLEMTASYLVFYAYKRGTYYNISGRHFRHYHDGVTGNFIKEEKTNREELIFKQRILKADLLQLHALRSHRLNNSKASESAGTSPIHQ